MSPGDVISPVPGLITGARHAAAIRAWPRIGPDLAVTGFGGASRDGGEVLGTSLVLGESS